jgi:cytochrome c556
MTLRLLTLTLLLPITLLQIPAALADSDATEQRQQLYNEIDDQSEQLETLILDQQWQQAIPIANALVYKADLLHTLFPLSSRGEGRAKDAVWNEWPQFSDRLNRLSRGFAGVAYAIEQQDYRAAEQSLEQATSLCRGCHIDYRSLW